MLYWQGQQNFLDTGVSEPLQYVSGCARIVFIDNGGWGDVYVKSNIANDGIKGVY